MRWFGEIGKRYHRARPSTSRTSCTVAGELKVSGSAFGQAALSPVVRMHSDGAGVIALAGDVTVIVTNWPEPMPGTPSKRT